MTLLLPHSPRQTILCPKGGPSMSLADYVLLALLGLCVYGALRAAGSSSCCSSCSKCRRRPARGEGGCSCHAAASACKKATKPS